MLAYAVSSLARTVIRSMIVNDSYRLSCTSGSARAKIGSCSRLRMHNKLAALLRREPSEQAHAALEPRSPPPPTLQPRRTLRKYRE